MTIDYAINKPQDFIHQTTRFHKITTKPRDFTRLSQDIKVKSKIKINTNNYQINPKSQ